MKKNNNIETENINKKIVNNLSQKTSNEPFEFKKPTNNFLIDAERFQNIQVFTPSPENY